MNKLHQIKHNAKLDLDSIDADATPAFKGDKSEAEAKLKELKERLTELQELLYAESKHKMLIVLQAMDTAGKDSTIRFVFEGVNPQGVQVARFQVPSVEEAGHDFLWRVHKRTPPKGNIMIFNRSHYEDVVTVGVHGIVDEPTIEERYDSINNFEQMLCEEGVTILKFFLHISKKEQKDRLQARLDDPKKHWKFSLGDIHERKSWDKYMHYYEKAISKTSTPWAPWYVIPANKKWYRNIVIAQTIVDHLEKLNMKYPKLTIDPKKVFFK